jgi:hypothetical protein
MESSKEGGVDESKQPNEVEGDRWKKKKKKKGQPASLAATGGQ